MYPLEGVCTGGEAVHGAGGLGGNLCLPPYFAVNLKLLQTIMSILKIHGNVIMELALLTTSDDSEVGGILPNGR